MEIDSPVVLSIGANLGQRKKNILSAIEKLKNWGEVIRTSSFYESEAVGFDSPDLFLNCCILYSTNLTPEDLLGKIHQLEQSLGRIRTNDVGYTSRTIDIDIIIFKEITKNTDELTLPHPKYHLRRFVLEPLAEIAPKLICPARKVSIDWLLAHCNEDERLKKIDS